MDLYARVWYNDSPNDKPTGPFPLPDMVGADALVQDMVGSGWYKSEIMDEAGIVTHVITRTEGDNYEVHDVRPKAEVSYEDGILPEERPIVGNMDQVRTPGRT